MLNRRQILRSTLHKRSIRRLAIVVAVLLGAGPAVFVPTAGAQSADTDTGYSTDAHAVAYATQDAAGVWSFSDIPDPAARTIALPQSTSTGLSSEELIEQMLDVAATLESARIAREERRALQSSVSENPALSPSGDTGQGSYPQSDYSPYTYAPYAPYSPYVYSPYDHPSQRRHHRSRPKPEPAPQPPERKNHKIRFPVDF